MWGGFGQSGLFWHVRCNGVFVECLRLAELFIIISNDCKWTSPTSPLNHPLSGSMTCSRFKLSSSKNSWGKVPYYGQPPIMGAHEKTYT